MAAADQGDPPSRVGRISFLSGSVAFEPANTTQWANATVNRPMTVGDKLWVDNGSKAEIEAGAATFHLGDKTGLSFLNLDDHTIQVQLSEGALSMRVRELHANDIYEVDTPNAAFTVTRAGGFRIDVNEAGDFTTITAWRGEGTITANGQTYDVHPGERAEFRGQDNNVQFQMAKAGEADKLDQWAQERDLRQDHSESAKYVSRDVPGYEDLDQYGQWSEQPDYGPVWYPYAVPVGWAPYTLGNWFWEDPWGWTWLDYEPWGFAPFHYGRWGFIGGRWGWYPGPIFAPPFYCPALVGFVGGFGWGFHFGFGWGGGVAWFPLGFGEVYHPWFHCGGVFLRNINISNTRITNINLINRDPAGMHYANLHVPGAVTAVSRSAFVNSQAVHNVAFHPNASQLASARVQSRVNFSPSAASRLGTQARGNVKVPPASLQNRAVVTRTQPAAGLHANARPAMASVNRSPQAASGNQRAGQRETSFAPQSHRAMELQQNRPPSAWHSSAANAARGSASANRSPANRSTNTRSDRPPQSFNYTRASAASPRSYSSTRPSYGYGGRSYSTPSRSSYSAPQNHSFRNYSAPRNYAAPSRSYSPAPRGYSYSAPRSYGGGHSYSGGGGHSGGFTGGSRGGGGRR
jgi:hypothetical protein